MAWPRDGEVVINNQIECNTDVRDATGVMYTCGTIDGRGRPAPTGGWQQRAGTRGGTNPPQWDGPAVLVLTGKIYAPTRQARQAAEDKLASVLDNDLWPLQVLDGNEPRVIYVRRNAPHQIQDLTANHSGWSVEVYAPDPLWYSTHTNSVTTIALTASTGGLTVPFTVPFTISAAATGGNVTVINSGSAAVWPTIHVPGPVTDPQFVNVTTGEWVKWVGRLTDDEWLDIDMASGTARLNGSADRSGFLTGSPWQLISGENLIGYRAALGGSTAATITWQNGWW